MRTSVSWIVAAVLGLTVAGAATADPPTKKERIVFWNLSEPASDGTKPAIEASILAIGDPVHETLTLTAARAAGIVPAAAEMSSPDVRDFIRGVFWNDDPCGQLFLNTTSLLPSPGIAWIWDFSKADKEKNDPKSFTGLSCTRLGRSHFGDLQFLHGMASGDGVPADDTLKLIIGWARFSYGVAAGKIAPGARLTDVAELQGLPGLDAATPRALFQSGNTVSLQRRALGSLAHMIQDSYGNGHTLRVVAANGSLGTITKFRSYAKQDHKKHRADDMWQGGSSDIDKIRNFKGGTEALAATTEVFKLFRDKAEWSAVESYLRLGPFRLSEQTQPSGP